MFAESGQPELKKTLRGHSTCAQYYCISRFACWNNAGGSEVLHEKTAGKTWHTRGSIQTVNRLVRIKDMQRTRRGLARRRWVSQDWWTLFSPCLSMSSSLWQGGVADSYCIAFKKQQDIVHGSVAQRTCAWSSDSRQGKPFHRDWPEPRITIWQFDGPVHIDIWAVGGERPVFFVRFAQYPSCSDFCFRW